jgi:hypothetical protein
MIVVATVRPEEASMRKLQLGLGMLAGAALLCSSVIAIAQDKKPPKKGPACNAINTQAPCEAREDCQWIAALMKNDKVARKAYCRAKSNPAPK